MFGDLTRAAALAGIVSMANGAGRILFGQAFDSWGYRRTMVTVCACVALAAAALLLAETTHLIYLLMIGFFLLGFGFGGMATCNSAFIAHFFGTKHYGMNFSLVTCNIIPASFVGPFCSNGSFSVAFLAMLGLAVASFTVTMLIQAPKQEPAQELAQMSISVTGH